MESEDGFAITLSLSPRRERPELCARLAPLNPPASGARDVPARSGSECDRRLGEGSGTSRLSEPLRPGTGRAPKEGSGEGLYCGTSAQGSSVREVWVTARPWAMLLCAVGESLGLHAVAFSSCASARASSAMGHSSATGRTSTTEP